MLPAAELERGGKTRVVLALIGAELRLADHERRIAHAEIQAVAIAGIGIVADGHGPAGSPLKIANRNDAFWP